MLKYLDFKEAKCKNCYKCLKECPVKAINILDNQATIIEDRCILCGRCTLICPQDAKKVHSELEEIKELLKSNKVIASVAPSFISNFNLKHFETINEALKKIGFAFAEETARGAKIVSDKYEEILQTKTYKNFITSCCPAINKMISLYYPNALKYLAPVDSPVIAHAKLLKQEYPDYKIVFIGPCIAKKRECSESGVVDGVLTFEELLYIFNEQNIELTEIEKDIEVTWNKARFYPISRGIIKSFEQLKEGYEYIAVDGVDRCKEVLEEIDNLENVFLELNACPSSCVNGPCSVSSSSTSITANAKIRRYVSSNSKIANKENQVISVDINHDYNIDKLIEKNPSEAEIKEVLAKIGKTKPEDELNCGACGYNTCREKAWAVINGYADIDLCLPYMRDRAENMSDEIIKNSPFGIIVMDKELKVVDINERAKSLLGIESIKVKEDYVVDYIEDKRFLSTLTKFSNSHINQLKIDKTNSYIEVSITYLQDHGILFAIMKDITEQVSYDEKLDKVKLETLAITDEVIKKQMRVAQEIASLLGETTAETKVALVNFKKALSKDNE